MELIGTILTVIIILYLVILFDLTATVETEHSIYEFEYNGLLWVILDLWTIVKYKSNDKVMKWFGYKKTLKQ